MWTFHSYTITYNIHFTCTLYSLSQFHSIWVLLTIHAKNWGWIWMSLKIKHFAFYNYVWHISSEILREYLMFIVLLLRYWSLEKLIWKNVLLDLNYKYRNILTAKRFQILDNNKTIVLIKETISIILPRQCAI